MHSTAPHTNAVASNGFMPLPMDMVTASDGLPSVLVLDDDPDVSETMLTLARSIGSQARMTQTAIDFFREWELCAADVAIIDLQMPGLDGLDVIRQLGKIGRASVILCSGCDTRVLEAARHAARNSGLDVVGILPKPVRRSALKKLLEGVHVQGAGKKGTASFEQASQIDAHALRLALNTGQICPYFQPKLRLRCGTLHGFEALARWEHPDLGLIQPDVFIPLAETFGLTRELTERIVDASLGFLSRLSGTELTMAVNVPMSICSEASFPDFLRTTLARYGLSPAHLILEVTEAGPLEISQAQIDALTRLRMQDFCLSIDDFGTGVSSLERLVRIPFNELKIDRYFARELGTSPAAEKLVRNLVRIATAMDMTVTIEGLEDESALQLSDRIGCEFGQGYHIARPMPAAKVIGWMSGRA